ncbi:hypothetical protein POV27_18220 [Aureisphaera galaxeae]|uniref:hypothetical protein n=1 Tax=Aureisphaera galaxeae TaxID=1538023 RepID=UPI002350A4A1|nr:hypothetical protein [Aureisphaera galaxeae]MDC8005993.1 hypothetical protein [Aureisphaera galaxeae]
MIHFFRRIRQKLLKENRLPKYLLYALGEIALVMIGILLALQVNNWNSQRLENDEIAIRYSRIHDEITSTLEQVGRKALLIDSIVVSNNRKSLSVLKSRDPDSVQSLHNTLSSLSSVITVTYDMPATTEFLEEGYASKIDNPLLKDLLLRLKRSLSFANTVDNYSNTQLNTLIEPYMMKHLNYAQIIKSSRMIPINKVEDFTPFFDDLELENLINLKIEADRTKVNYLTGFKNLLEATAGEIEKELQEHNDNS